MLSSFKFSKKDTPFNCADTKQKCVFLAFPSDLPCVSLLLRNKKIIIKLILYIIYIYVYIYIYIYIYRRAAKAGGRGEGFPLAQLKQVQFALNPKQKTCLF